MRTILRSLVAVAMAVLAMTATTIITQAQTTGGVFVAGTDIAFKDLRWQSWAPATYFMTLYNHVLADPAQNPKNLVMPEMYGGPTSHGETGQGPEWNCQFFGNPRVAGTGRLFNINKSQIVWT